MAGATMLLSVIDTPSSREASGVTDWPFALASATTIVPAIWGGARATGADHLDVDPAPVYLAVAAVFAANRYDAMVAVGVIDTVYIQPFAFPALVALAAAGAVGRRSRVDPRTAAGSPVRRSILRLTTLEETVATEERNRIARELHDSVSQTLYSIAMLADSLPTTLERDVVTGREHARQIRGMTLEALGSLRMLLVDMRHPTVASAPLGELLRGLAPGREVPVVVEIDLPGEPDLPDPIKLAAYRVAQEALRNAHRHAVPSRIVVRLEQQVGRLALTVADDGEGFEVGAATPAHHGLEIMRERAALIAADLAIDSEPGRGTRVTLSWPHPVGRRTLEEVP